MSNKRNGLLALLGIGALAYWKYKNMTPEEQDKIKSQINNAKRKFSEVGKDLKSKAESRFNEMKNSAEQRMDELRQDEHSFN